MSNTYTVESGDTMGKIAAKLGTTVAALAQANAIQDVNRIRVGQVLKIPGAAASTPASAPASPTPRRPPTPPPAASGHRLGALSAKFESGNRGPGTVSSGQGDSGGVSYGTYQLASTRKRPEEFLNAEGASWKAEFGGATSGTAAFSAVWRAIAAREAAKFGDAQHSFIKRTHYDPQVSKVRAATGVDMDRRCNAVRDAVWSTSVQHGPSTDVIVKAIGNRQLDDRALLEAIYAERGRKDPDGKLTRFRGNSAAVQAGVARRFRDELRDAIAMFDRGD